MAVQRLKQQRESLGRFLAYVLGHRPDEFGLVPDEEGFVSLKDLLKALSEEEGWRFVRRSHINDMMRETGQPSFEIRDNRMRLSPGETTLTLGPYEVAEPPARLYYAARRKAHPVILERGLIPAGRPHVQLSTTEEMALRLGKRRDPNPILLTVQAGRASEQGTVFYRPQELIYLVEAIRPDFIVSPPLPKEKPVVEKKKKKEPQTPTLPETPGSFFWDPAGEHDPRLERDKTKKKKKDGPDWKRDARKERRRRKNDEFGE